MKSVLKESKRGRKEFEFLGRFPPPYGGVTVKNALLFDELSKTYCIVSAERERGVCNQAIMLLHAAIRRTPFIIGISASRRKSEIVSRLLFCFNRKSMRQTIYFMSGGVEAKKISENKNLVRIYGCYLAIYVETRGMKKILEEAGLKNVSLFPNCRKRPLKIIDIKENRYSRLKCVFFSNINKTKGVNDILDAAMSLKNVDFYFYGHIDDEYQAEFHERVSIRENIRYMGIFVGGGEECYSELSKYDILLLPTHYKTEGVPGVLIEGKISGLAEIVSDVCYNSELVKDGVEGIVVNLGKKNNLENAIRTLDDDRDLLYHMKVNSQKSAEDFIIDNYMEEIIMRLNKCLD